MGVDEKFFMDLDDTVPQRNTFGNKGSNWTPAGAMKWYDQIIDDLLANPGTNLTDCAARLGRHPNTVQTIARSDLFNARFAQRRAQYEEALNQRLVAKLTRVADLSLDNTILVLEKKRDAVPLPLLNDITKTALDRLGYSPAREAGSAVQVTLNNNVVSAEALAQAREKLKLVEQVQTPAVPRTHAEGVRPQDPGEAWPSLRDRPFASDPAQQPPRSGRPLVPGEPTRSVDPEAPVAGQEPKAGGPED
jgi:hypothetical protein